MNPLEPKHDEGPRAITRRAAIKTGIKGIVAYSLAPQFLQAALSGPEAPSNRIALGLVGNGLICTSHYTGLIGRDD